MKIEERVVQAIAQGIAREFNAALSTICPALEATARRKRKKARLSQSEIKNFLREYYWLLEPFSGEGINFETSTFPSMNLVTDNGRRIEKPDVADIIYHVYRCALAHGHEIEPRYQLVPTQEQGLHEWQVALDGKTLRAPEALLWGMIAVVVFCEANRELKTTTNLYLSWGGGTRPMYRFDIILFWGGEAVVHAFFDKLDRMRVTMEL